MKRRIVILNLVLAGAVVFAGLQLRNQWQAARAREAATLRRPAAKPAPAPPYYPLPGTEPVLAAGYKDIAQKMLFDPSRNSTIVVEVQAPPPPKPMPAKGAPKLGPQQFVAASKKAEAVPALTPKLMAELEKLSSLRASGILNDQEFENARKRLLARG